MSGRLLTHHKKLNQTTLDGMLSKYQQLRAWTTLYTFICVYSTDSLKFMGDFKVSGWHKCLQVTKHDFSGRSNGRAFSPHSHLPCLGANVQGIGRYDLIKTSLLLYSHRREYTWQIMDILTKSTPITNSGKSRTVDEIAQLSPISWFSYVSTNKIDFLEPWNPDATFFYGR